MSDIDGGTPASEGAEPTIDPQWWGSVYEEADALSRASVEALSGRFRQLSQAPGLDDLQQKVLVLLADVTSARLQPDNWLEPFTPLARWGAERTIVPADLDAEQLALLGRLVPLADQTPLRARLADVAWTYGDRSNMGWFDAAVDAYRSAPLDDETWFRGGHDAWRRAFELLARRRDDGRAKREEMRDALVARLLAADLVSDFRPLQWAQLLRAYARPDVLTVTAITAQLTTLASDEHCEPALARALETEAAAWFGEGDATAKNACLERAARTYVAEADARIAADPQSGALVEGHFLELAIAAFRKLPRRYRAEHGLEDEITALTARLGSSRELALESMMRIESEPVDISDYVAYARQRVAGVTSAWEALVLFSTVAPPISAAAVRQSAETIGAGSLSRLFQSTTFTRDGRKVASRPGGLEDGEAVVWDDMVRTVAMQASFTAQGMVLPAQQVLTFEHTYTRQLLTDIAAQSPTVPERHEELWGAGLALGLSGDYGVAVTVLVPQLEHLVRRIVKSLGANTLNVDEQGVETEKGLGLLLQLPEATRAFGDDIVLEMRALLTEQRSANLRNEIAHGLIDDANAWSYTAVYAWWLCLRLVIVPLWNAQQPVAAETTEEAEQEDG